MCCIHVQDYMQVYKITCKITCNTTCVQDYMQDYMQAEMCCVQVRLHAVCFGETWRKLKTRNKKHESKVRLTNEDLKWKGSSGEWNGEWKNGKGGRVECLSEVDWENTKAMSKECDLRQRKVKERIESLGEMNSGEKY